MFHQIVGWGGTVLMVLAYYLVSHHKVSVADVSYQAMNLVGAGMLSVILFEKGAWPALGMEATWAVIAASGLIKIYRHRKKRRRL